jgi:hypothetical protein
VAQRLFPDRQTLSTACILICWQAVRSAAREWPAQPAADRPGIAAIGPRSEQACGRQHAPPGAIGWPAATAGLPRRLGIPSDWSGWAKFAAGRRGGRTGRRETLRLIREVTFLRKLSLIPAVLLVREVTLFPEMTERANLLHSSCNACDNGYRAHHARQRPELSRHNTFPSRSIAKWGR